MEQTGYYCFTVDDNVRFLSELSEKNYKSIFDHPYLRVYKRLHEKFGAKVQLNLFYEAGDFNLTHMTERYIEQWRQNSDWLKLSFHSRLENEKPYESASYREVYDDCLKVNREIVRFASDEALAKTTTVHYCKLTNSGITALRDLGVTGLLGLYGTKSEPFTSYQSVESECEKLRQGAILCKDGIAYAAIDLILNKLSLSEIYGAVSELIPRPVIKLMIHEQYFYPDYPRYQSDFENKLTCALKILDAHGYESKFFEEVIHF